MTPPPTSTAERTGRAIVAGTWVCAAIVMLTSAGNAVLTFGDIGGNRAIGLGLGVAVDVALFVGLVGDRRLASYGLTSHWGRALRVTAAAMSLVLNVGGAARHDLYFLAVLLGFLPVLLCVVTEYGQDVLLKFGDVTRDAGRDQHAEELAAARQARDVVTAELTQARRELETQRDTAQLATVRVTQERDTLSRRVEQLTIQLAAALRDTRDQEPATATSTPAERRAWVRQQRDAGHRVTGADVHRRFPNAPRDGARIVRQVEAELTTNTEPRLAAV